MRFSIIIVHHNTPDYLRRSLLSASRIESSVSHEVIVVDNASKGIESLTQEFPQIRWIKNAGNPGWGAAVNQAARVSRGEILVFLNPDAEIAPVALQELDRFFKEHDSERLGPVGGRLLYSDGSYQPSCGPFPHLGNLLWRLALPAKKRRYYLNMNPGHLAPVDWVTGAFMAVRRDVFDATGGFDADFFLYYEDADFCLRARQKGYPAHYLPQAVAYHHNPYASRQDRSPELRPIIQASRLLYFKKHRPAWESWALGKLHLLEGC